ncbi:flippase-like domain-containing protein [Erysipelotrichaceae bacterium OttesenSCG-928-M19]|nr:flippase-like domain-containing protein [Erysipelotrichaceae bacterium OttesenSCG-928-M19]
MKNNKRNFFIILVMAFVVMVFSFKNDYENIIMMFSNVNFLWLMIAILILVVYHLLDSYFIYYYCKKHNSNYTFLNAIQAEQTGVFFSAITPFSSGGQFAQVLVFSKQKINTKQSASMLMLSFISWQTVLVAFGIIVLAFNYSKMLATYSAFFNLVFLGFLINFIVIVGLFLAAFSKKFHYFIFAKVIPLLGKIRIIKDVAKKRESTQIWLKLFRDEFNNLLLHRDLMIRRFLIDIIKILTLYSIPFFAARALNIDLDLNALKMIIILTGFIYMITAFVPLPGAAGGTEGTFVLLLNPVFGAATTSVMLLWRFLTYYLTMFISFIIFAIIKEMKK